MDAAISGVRAPPTEVPINRSAPLDSLCQAAGQTARVGGLGQRRLVSGQSSRAPGVQNPVFVHGDDVLHPCGLQHLDDGGARRPRAVLHHPDPADVLADDLEGIEYAGQHDDGGAVLVVMEYRNIQIPFQFCFDLKAFGAADVFQVDAAEGGGDRLDRRHHLLLGGGVQTDGERIHAAELLEQNALALHDRQAGFRADVAQAQHGSAVGDHRDGAAFEGIA